ncbi:MAG: zinc metallopeptidase [Clostridia bacterium]|nr:zinc metallopeptidase [Clostridia bacterium]
MDFFITYWIMGLIMVPGFILAIIAESKVFGAYRKYKQVSTYKGQTAAQVAREILDKNGLYDTAITRVSGEMTDHFDPKNNIVALSEGVHDSTSIAAIGIATHEVGHAIQHAQGYGPAKLRLKLVPVINISSNLLWPLLLIGVIFNVLASTGVWGFVFMWIAIAFFGISVLFSLITLPTELDASKRALKILDEEQYLVGDELKGAKKVLNAAALTYIASLVNSILTVLRFVLTILVLRNNE